MKNKLSLLFFPMVMLAPMAYSGIDSSTAKADIKITKVMCLKEGKTTGYVAIAQVKKTIEGHLSSEIKIFFDTKKKDAVSFLQGDEAVVTIHKEFNYWIVKSPQDKEGSVFTLGMLPTCY